MHDTNTKIMHTEIHNHRRNIASLPVLCPFRSWVGQIVRESFLAFCYFFSFASSDCIYFSFTSTQERILAVFLLARASDVTDVCRSSLSLGLRSGSPDSSTQRQILIARRLRKSAKSRGKLSIPLTQLS